MTCFSTKFLTTKQVGESLYTYDTYCMICTIFILKYTKKKHISYFKLQISLFFFAKTTCRRLILLIGALSCILYVLLFSLDRIHTVQLMMNYLPEHKRCRCLLMPWSQNDVIVVTFHEYFVTSDAIDWQHFKGCVFAQRTTGLVFCSVCECVWWRCQV